ncbi:MAG: hypothetical protein R8J94_12675 [Acidimicrobiia bacterium]|nr:hypothetical protein [Acidimicrobiia bacterium]
MNADATPDAFDGAVVVGAVVVGGFVGAVVAGGAVARGELDGCVAIGGDEEVGATDGSAGRPRGASPAAALDSLDSFEGAACGGVRPSLSPLLALGTPGCDWSSSSGAEV